ncbi:MAG: SpoIIE family protein phosphatase [Bacteroidetes bacterium]|nr:SpoIIE family protein phosphatase [Bacteroidota bacterium]
MKFRFPQHQLYRIAAATVFLILFVEAIVTFYGFFRTPTDENIFRNPPSRFMVVKSFRGFMMGQRPFAGTQQNRGAISDDSVRTGDLIISINNGAVKTMKDAMEAIDHSPQAEIRFEVLRPSMNTVLTFTASRSSLQDQFLVLLPIYVYVTDVLPGGASDRGGMKVGDLILRINEQEFVDMFEADRILRLGQIGKSLKYEVLRNNHFVELNIVLAKFGIPIALLAFTLGGMIWMLIGIFIAASRPKLVAARLIGVAFILIGFILATLLLAGRDFIVTPEVFIRRAMIIASYIIGTALMFHSMHYFPLERTDLIERKWIGRGYYIVSALSAGLNILFNSILPLLLIVLYGIGVMVIYRKGASPEYRRYNNIMKWTGYGVGVAVALVSWIFFNSIQTVGLGFIGGILLALPFSYLYTIARYRLLDMKFRVRRNTQYSIVTIIWGGAVFYGLVWCFFQLPMLDLPKANIVFTGTAIEINDAPELANQRGTSERVMQMALAIALTFAILRMRIVGQKFIDKKYFRQQYDYRKASFELGEVLASTLSAEELAKGLVQKLSELMKLKRVGVLFFRDEKSCSCLSAQGFDGTEWEQFCISHEQELIGSIVQFDNEFRIDYLPAQLKDEFHREGFHYGIPIRSKEKLIGVLLVGEKQSETTFQQEDLAFLSSTAKQASVAIENAFLYEQLAEKERMKHELQIARKIQLDSLPQTTPSVHGLDISGTSIPAMEVGGDFFDYLSNGNGKITVVIGDVSGKGTSAALYMSKVQGILRSLHGFELPPKDLFNRANKLLCKDLEKRSFVTVLGAEFNTEKKTISVSRAGHLPLWHYNSVSGTVSKVLPRGLGLGLNDASVFTTEMEERKVSYHAGDIFLFATDGVTEAHNAHGDFGEERLLNILQSYYNESALSIQTKLLEDLSEFVGDREQHDDQTIVVVKAV